MAARERILARIREAQGRRTQQAQDLQFARKRGPIPEPEDDPVTQFCAHASASASTVERIASSAAVPGAVAGFLVREGFPRQGCVWPALAGLDWAGAGLELAVRGAGGDDKLGITGVFCAIAETGTLMLVSGPDTPATASLLPETHVALVPASRIVRCMEDAWDLARAELGELPRAVNFISGPSRTADIEQTMVLGAHGPYRVHILVLDE